MGDQRKKVVSAQVRQEQVTYAVERDLSQPRACALMRTPRSGQYYERKMSIKDAPVVDAIKDLWAQFPRFVAHRIHVFLDRQRLIMGKDRCARI